MVRTGATASRWAQSIGIADASPQQNIQLLGEQLDNQALPTDFVWLKRAVEDIKAYYFEAMTAQPGDYDRETILTVLARYPVRAAVLSLLPPAAKFRR